MSRSERERAEGEGAKRTKRECVVRRRALVQAELTNLLSESPQCPHAASSFIITLKNTLMP